MTETTPAFPWPPGSATGVGSMPGADFGAAQRLVFEALPELPYLVELPARGVGADMIGRGVALLVDLHTEVQPSGWRFVAAGGRDERRARSHLRADLDVLEELAQGYAGPLKVQAVGPWTLASTVELTRGPRALSDPGACRDLAESLAEGLAGYVKDVQTRVPGASVVLQLDEPALPAALAGTVPTVSGLGRLRPVEAGAAKQALARVVGSAGVPVVVHCCAARVPVALLADAGAAAVSVDMRLMRTAEDEAYAEALEAGLALYCGIVPAADAELSDPRGSVEPVRTWWRRLGFRPERLASSVVLTPACGLAGASPAYARAASAHVRAAARALLDDPEG